MNGSSSSSSSTSSFRLLPSPHCYFITCGLYIRYICTNKHRDTCILYVCVHKTGQPASWLLLELLLKWRNEAKSTMEQNGNYIFFCSLTTITNHHMKDATIPLIHTDICVLFVCLCVCNKRRKMHVMLTLLVNK